GRWRRYGRPRLPILPHLPDDYMVGTFAGTGTAHPAGDLRGRARGGSSMSLRMRGLVATLLVAAIGIPYVGYLINGEMPFIQDPRGMSAVGLVLGIIAFLVMRAGDAFDRLGKAETGVRVRSLGVGIV